MTATQLTTDIYGDMTRAVEDFEGHLDPEIGNLTKVRVADHMHLYRSGLVCALFAVAAPDEELAARITVTDSCPMCAPPRHEHAPARRYTVNYEMGW